jgi:hypothetical protein
MGDIASARLLWVSARLCSGATAICLAAALGVPRVQATLVPCDRQPEMSQVVDALVQIRRSVDPCGESAQVIAVLDTVERCAKRSYRICTNPQTARNVFDRPMSGRGETPPRTITWNPALRSELERGCGGDGEKPVLRDPTASLLHELVHAAQDCQGLNPGEHEIEAVRIENIYRRAAGLCQRAGYGEDPLPVQVMKDCVPGHCSCSASANSGELVRTEDTPSRRQPGDGALHVVEERFSDGTAASTSKSRADARRARKWKAGAPPPLFGRGRAEARVVRSPEAPVHGTDFAPDLEIGAPCGDLANP